jgi:hypothetical protein
MLHAQLSDVPADFLKSFLLVIFSLLAGAGSAIGIARFFRKVEQREISPQPLQVMKVGDPLTVDSHEQRHAEVDRRLTWHDGQINDLWNTMRREDEAIRADLGKSVKEIERALGRIEGYIEHQNERR